VGHDVEHDDVWSLAPGELEPRLSARGLDHLVSCKLEVDPAPHEDVGLVVDHQDPHRP
jgi:hypothetical protein